MVKSTDRALKLAQDVAPEIGNNNDVKAASEAVESLRPAHKPEAGTATAVDPSRASDIGANPPTAKVPTATALSEDDKNIIEANMKKADEYRTNVLTLITRNATEEQMRTIYDDEGVKTATTTSSEALKEHKKNSDTKLPQKIVGDAKTAFNANVALTEAFLIAAEKNIGRDTLKDDSEANEVTNAKKATEAVNWPEVKQNDSSINHDTRSRIAKKVQELKNVAMIMRDDGKAPLPNGEGKQLTYVPKEAPPVHQQSMQA